MTTSAQHTHTWPRQTFHVAVANHRRERYWKNLELSWDAFLERVKTTRRTVESVSEYAKLPKTQQDEIKDVGGFVAGFLRGGLRKGDHVESRSMLTLDMDYAEAGVWEQIQKGHAYACCLYSTHKSAPEALRLRLIIPLSRDITAEEYGAVSRMIAKQIGIEQFDDTTYEPSRLMYWPSTSCDGHFLFEQKPGSLLDPDAVLALYRDWKDTGLWPVSSRQTRVILRQSKQVQDPLAKQGLVGAFCRSYSIEDVISAYLSEVYEESHVPGRYDYIPADSTAGLVVYDGTFAYSNHATDPAHGRLLNAFDLVRLHKYADLDEEAKEGTPVAKLPSTLAMLDLVKSDGRVLATLDRERLESVQSDFADDNWRAELDRDKAGTVKDSSQNLSLIFHHDEALKGIVFNELADGMEILSEVPWPHPSKFWRDQDDAQLTYYLDLRYGRFSKRTIDTVVTAIVDNRSYHPIKNYLACLPSWDKTPRLETLFVDYLGADDTAYVRAVTRKIFCAAVRRVQEPGVKFDYVPVLQGPQGIGKSTLIAKLGGEWFSDSLSLNDIHDKTAAEKMQGYWLIEISELSGMRKTEIETLRGFISRQNDIYRASYGRRATPHPRQGVFFGTTNAQTGYLRDVTGNRRFWPISTPGTGRKRSWQLEQAEVDQIWAEALILARNEKLYLSPDLEWSANAAQRGAMEFDEREGLVRDYLDKLLPENWEKLDTYERRAYLLGTDFGAPQQQGTVMRKEVCNMEIWCECFGKERSALKRADSVEIQTLMSKIEGWGSVSKKARRAPYGVQWIYLRERCQDIGNVDNNSHAG